MTLRWLMITSLVGIAVALSTPSASAWVDPQGDGTNFVIGPHGFGFQFGHHRRCDPADPNACGPERYCRLPDGVCDSADVLGFCTRIPHVCPDVWAPVCGCDGVTYGNECEARAHRASIRHPGECEAICGGILGIPCESDEFCLFPPGSCHISDQQGICVPVPNACPDVYIPVCGCDGMTYGNACEAIMAGVQIDHLGECHQVCGGILGIPCDAGEFCELPDGHCCCDFQGLCQPIPQGCPDVWDPVCGCDGVTYSNRCDANAAGMSVDHVGPCEQPCDGFLGIPCDKGEFCLHPYGICDGADIQGHCVPVPNACPENYDPVCGCDGVTYSNECFAVQAGVQIDHAGACPQVCGGILGIPCGPGEFCELPDGHCCCDFQGLCQTIPLGCPDVWDPVCGCDGVTYSNRCDANAAGMSVDHVGPCEPLFCDGLLGIPCPPGEFCLHPIGTCDTADIQGHCVPQPQFCTAIYQPVCGCDGVTYSNACEAINAGVQIDHQGTCGAVCGGFAGIPCPNGEFCRLPIGLCCCDHQGECMPIPTGCPDVWDPVCGCDGMTYGNACEAAAAGQSIDHVGECGQVCGGFAGIPCPTGQFCNLPIGSCCCDFQGVCENIPTVCPDVWFPVCGCDGNTYGNPCEAAAAQVSIDHLGECP